MARPNRSLSVHIHDRQPARLATRCGLACELLIDEPFYSIVQRLRDHGTPVSAVGDGLLTCDIEGEVYVEESPYDRTIQVVYQGPRDSLVLWQTEREHERLGIVRDTSSTGVRLRIRGNQNQEAVYRGARLTESAYLGAATGGYARSLYSGMDAVEEGIDMAAVGTSSWSPPIDFAPAAARLSPATQKPIGTRKRAVTVKRKASE